MPVSQPRYRPALGVKPRGHFDEGQRIFMVLQYLLTHDLLVSREENNFFFWRNWTALWVMRINIAREGQVDLLRV